VEVLKTLVELSADIQAKTDEGMAPLHMTAFEGPISNHTTV